MDALTNLDPIAIAAVAVLLSLIALVVTLIVFLRQRLLLKRYRLILGGPTGQDLEAILLKQANEIGALQTGLGQHARTLTTMAQEARPHIQKIGVVRFNAFPDTGSDLSFAIAMLNADDNGFVITNLYGRTESRVYAKPVQAGKSTYTLSDEEKEAIAKAMAISKR